MKFIFFAVVLAGCWFAYQWLQRPAAQAVIKAPERYVKSLAEDERRAADAAAKANAAIQQTQRAVNAVVEEGERKQ